MTRRDLERRYALLSALRWLPIGLVLPFFTLLPLARGLSLAAVGAVFAVHGALILVLEVPSGALADTVGRKRTLLGGGVLTTAGLALFAVALDLPAFALSMALIGVGRSLISGALEAWFVDSVRATDPGASLRTGLAGGVALNGVALGGGALVGGAVPLLFGGLAASGDDLLIRSSLPAVLGAAAGLLYLVALVLLVHEPPRRTDPSRSFGGDLREVLTTAVSEARRTRVVPLVLGVAFTLGVALSAYEMLWPPRLAEIVGGVADDTFLYGALAAAGMLVGAAFVAVGVRLSRRFGAGPAYVGSLLATAVTLGLLAAAGTEVVFVVAFVAVSAAVSIGEPLHQEFLHEAVGDRARATLVSVESLAIQLGAVLSNLGLAALAGAVGIATAWLVGAGVLLVGAALAAAVARS